MHPCHVKSKCSSMVIVEGFVDILHVHSHMHTSKITKSGLSSHDRDDHRYDAQTSNPFRIALKTNEDTTSFIDAHTHIHIHIPIPFPSSKFQFLYFHTALYTTLDAHSVFILHRLTPFMFMFPITNHISKLSTFSIAR